MKLTKSRNVGLSPLSTVKETEILPVCKDLVSNPRCRDRIFGLRFGEVNYVSKKNFMGIDASTYFVWRQTPDPRILFDRIPVDLIKTLVYKIDFF